MAAACVICYNDFGVENPEGINEAPLRLPKCKHVFGDHCIKKWFEESDSCPYCRDKVHSEPQLRQQSIMALFRGHYTNQTFPQRQARDVANAQVRSGGGPADGVRGGPFRFVPLSLEVADLTADTWCKPARRILRRHIRAPTTRGIFNTCLVAELSRPPVSVE